VRAAGPDDGMADLTAAVDREQEEYLVAVRASRASWDGTVRLLTGFQGPRQKAARFASAAL